MPVRKLKAAAKKKSTKSRKRTGDILGLSAARVPKGTPRATADRGGRPKGVELPKLSKRRVLRPARVRG